MKTKLLIVILILMISQTFGNSAMGKNPVVKYEVIIRTSEGTVRAWVSAVKTKNMLKDDRVYWGYYMNGLFCKQGELEGRPLNGKFCRYDVKDNILESGNFKQGLKEGLWKNLSSDGVLTESDEYRDGVLHGERVIYKNGKADVLEKYRKGILKGKPKHLNVIESPKDKKRWKGYTELHKVLKRVTQRKNKK
jgi:antitoxin component YwqK of YwqJK toxin-antitoxin module